MFNILGVLGGESFTIFRGGDCHGPDSLFLSVCVIVIVVVLVVMVLATAVGVITSAEAVINRVELIK